jgi:hypothetical protein
MADLKNVCLVSRTWRDIARPFLWETFKTDLRPTTTKQMDVLLAASSGILPHVRDFTITDCVFDPVAEDRLQSFFSALPADFQEYATSISVHDASAPHEAPQTYVLAYVSGSLGVV